MKRLFSKKTLSCTLIFIFSLNAFAQHNLTGNTEENSGLYRTAEAGFAEEEFRRGVQSYYRGAFNESIREFEKALSYLPGENLILDWLGKSYYRSGIEGSALQQWQFALDQGYGGILLQNRIEIVSERRLKSNELTFNQRWTESGTIENSYQNTLIYSAPVSVLPNDDGSVWVAAYGTNELIRFDVNGFALERSRGPVNGLDRPMDIIRMKDGSLLVSEFAGDRLCLLNEHGFFKKYIGEKGRGQAQFIGPQYLAQDSFGNIYVTDFGNSRVVVMDSEGNGLFTFGNKSGDFKGFKSPTGIAIVDDRVFVADSVRGAIYEFDRAGNYAGVLVKEKTFARPETIKVWNGILIVTDRNRVVTVDTSNGAVYENARTGNAPSRITCAVPDANGNLIVTDFKNNEIYVMAKMNELVGGFFVQIERVIADNFPEVILEARIENRRRQPVIGLDSQNFLITEGKRPVENMELIGCANNNKIADITILIDRLDSSRLYEEELKTAVREIASTMAKGSTLRVVSAGKIPLQEFRGDPERLKDFSPKSLKCSYTDDASLDLAVRLCANDLITAEKKRGIVFITAGENSQNAFAKYGLSDLTAYLNNNSISFSTILLKQGKPSDEISFLSEDTNGDIYYVYRSEGLSSLVSDITSLPSGLYQFKYTSSSKTEYGLKYIPVEIETYLLNKSGRDETGYFAPLQ